MTNRFFKLTGPILIVLLLSLFFAEVAIAGGIINKQNQSAEYIRTLNRNAATDAADIASFNPAGIMQMSNGFYAKLDVMYYAKDYSNDVPGYGKLDQDDPSVIPALFTIYKKKKWAGFFAFTIPAGGGTLDYANGNARTVELGTRVSDSFNSILGTSYDQIDPGKLEVKQSTVLGFTLGVSYAINDAWSLAVGTRFSTGTREFDGEATISSSSDQGSPQTLGLNLEEDASGWAGILGLNFAPNEKLNTALTFISNTKMEYEMDVKRDTTFFGSMSLAEAIGFADGSKRRIDIPGLLGFGISYRFVPDFKVDVNYTYYLEEDAEIDTYEDEGNSWDLGISGEYTFNPNWRASIGYLWTNIKVDDDQQINEPEEPKLDANSIGAGVVWKAMEDMDITLAALYSMYDEVTDSQGIEYDKTVTNISVGIQYRFF